MIFFLPPTKHAPINGTTLVYIYSTVLEYSGIQFESCNNTELWSKVGFFCLYL